MRQTPKLYHLGRLDLTSCRGSLDDRSIGHPYWIATGSTKLVPGPDSSDMPHTVLKVGGLFANEAWILDVAGCQYGFREALAPLEKYLADKSCRIVSEPTTYDATETKDLDYFSTLPFLNKTRAQREDQKMERQARLHFAVFVKRSRWRV